MLASSSVTNLARLLVPERGERNFYLFAELWAARTLHIQELLDSLCRQVVSPLLNLISDRIEAVVAQLQGVTPTIPSGFTTAVNNLSGNGMITTFQTGVTAGGQNPSFTSGASSYDGFVTAAGFQLTGGGGGGGTPPLRNPYGCRQVRAWFAAVLLIFSIHVAHANALLDIKQTAFVSFAINGPPTNPTFYLPTGDVLHYADPAGNDNCNGTSPSLGSSGNCAWATFDHPMNCGDVIIFAPSTAYGQLSPGGTVSNCPSTTGGIDGHGGVYFAIALCGGAHVGDCAITTNAATTGNTTGMLFNVSNWAAEGWYINTGLATGKGGVAQGRAFEANSQGRIAHHFAFINDISANNLQATDTDDNGTTGTAAGVDYFATVGVIAQNSAQDGICLAAIDVVGPGVYDTLPGTHFYINGNFSYANTNVHCQSVSDTEDYMADTWDAHDVNSKGVYSNNVGYSADRNCIQLFEQSNYSATPTINVYNNTCFKNDLNTGSDNSDSEINLNSTTNPMLYNTTIQNNLAYQPLATSSGGHVVYAYEVAQQNSTLTVGGSGAQNFFLGSATSCIATVCDNSSPPFSAAAFSPATSAELGTNTYTNPGYTNTTDLLANQQGVPNCSGFENTTECMGWNANTAVLTTPSVISDLVPTASGTAGKGYQLPSITCITTGPVASDYPTWLKGIVYLHWNGTSITENAGLVTKPCGM
jgi:hypothetical protein